MMMGWQFMGVGGWLWMLAAILFVVGLVVVIASAIGGRSSSSDDDAVAILRARFARGEIDADQFAQVRGRLGHRASGQPDGAVCSRASSSWSSACWLGCLPGRRSVALAE